PRPRGVRWSHGAPGGLATLRSRGGVRGHGFGGLDGGGGGGSRGAGGLDGGPRLELAGRRHGRDAPPGNRVPFLTPGRGPGTASAAGAARRSGGSGPR